MVVGAGEGGGSHGDMFTFTRFVFLTWRCAPRALPRGSHQMRRGQIRYPVQRTGRMGGWGGGGGRRGVYHGLGWGSESELESCLCSFVSELICPQELTEGGMVVVAVVGKGGGPFSNGSPVKCPSAEIETHQLPGSYRAVQGWC